MTPPKTVEDLPIDFIVLPEGVRCGVCGRGWRVPGLILNDKNYGYLVDHAEGHAPRSALVDDGSEARPF